MHPIDEFAPIVLWLLILGMVCLILLDPGKTGIKRAIRWLQDRWRRS